MLFLLSSSWSCLHRDLVFILSSSGLHASFCHLDFILSASCLHPVFMLSSSCLHPVLILYSSILHVAFMLSSCSLHRVVILYIFSSNLHIWCSSLRFTSSSLRSAGPRDVSGALHPWSRRVWRPGLVTPPKSVHLTVHHLPLWNCRGVVMAPDLAPTWFISRSGAKSP